MTTLPYRLVGHCRARGINFQNKQSLFRLWGLDGESFGCHGPPDNAFLGYNDHQVALAMELGETRLVVLHRM